MKKINDGIEFTTISDIYGPDYRGEPSVLIKENATSRFFVRYPSKITAVTEIFNEKGELKKDYIRITHEDHGDKVVKGSYKRMIKLLSEEKTKPIGYGNKVKKEKGK
jgi:hypothetical protein